MNILDVRVDDHSVGAVQTDSALHGLSRKTVDPQTIEREVMRHAGQISLIRVTKPNEIVDEVAGGEGSDLEADQFVVVRARRSLDDRIAADVGTELRQ